MVFEEFFCDIFGDGETNRREVTLRILLTFTAFCDYFVKRHVPISATHLAKVARLGYF